MTILVPIDPTEPSRAAVRLAGLMATEQDHDVVLFHASTARPPLDYLAALHRVGQPLRDLGLNVRLRTALARPGPAICAEALARSCAWIVMGTRRPIATGIANNGLAMHIMTHSDVPVLAVRPGVPAGNGPTAWISPVSGEARRIAQLIGRAEGRADVRLFPGLQGGGPIRDGAGRVQNDLSSVVIDFSPTCVHQDWCQRVLQDATADVLLVRGRHCACETGIP